MYSTCLSRQVAMPYFGVIANNLKRYKRLVVLIFVTVFLLQYVGIGISFLNNFGTYEDYTHLEYFDNFYASKEFPNVITRTDEYDLATRAAEDNSDLCPEYPPNLVGNVSTSENFMRDRPWSDVAATNSELLQSGYYSPKKCRARHKVAMIIPLRGRETQLRILLSHMLPIWQRQQIDFQVYTITQAGDHLFNRAKLINAGVAEAKKDRLYDCYVFHDVDLLLENDRCLYWCHDENPRHVAMYMDKFSYKPLIYDVPCSPVSVVRRVPYFGGVSMLTHKQFVKANGFSNLYWGWGGEDDDIYLRLWSKGYSMANPYDNKCSFKMIPHDHESSNADNEARYSLLYYSISRMEKEGYRTLKYRVLSKENKKLYTNITVDIGRPTKKMVDFMSHKLPWIAKCTVKMPWR